VDDRVAWYNISQIEGLGSVKIQSIARCLNDLGKSASYVSDLEPIEIAKQIGVKEDLADRLYEQLRHPLELPKELDEVKFLLPDDDYYPNHRFLSAVPPLPALLWAIGSCSLLAQQSKTLGIAGSRETTSEILDLVRSFAHQASRKGWLIVSGLAKGVDMAAHEGAIDGGLGTIGVLASGISKAESNLNQSELDEVAIISQFEPPVPWSGQRAMQRNSTIAGLSDRVLIAASGLSGGSWEMAQLCLKKGKDVFVFDLTADEAEGNQKLIKAGATPLNREDFSEAFDDVLPDTDRLL